MNKLEKHILSSPVLLNLQHYNHSSLSYDHNQVIYSLPWEAKLGFPFLGQPFSPYMSKLKNIIALLHLSITYFIWYMARYTMKRTRAPCKVTKSTKLRGAQRSSELGLRSTDFRAHKNLIFPALQCNSLRWIFLSS